ncbi:MAG: hypothetical protein AAB443_04920 [Patescibacteria group bacterium]
MKNPEINDVKLDLEEVLGDEDRLKTIFEDLDNLPSSVKEKVLRDITLTQDHPQLAVYAREFLQKYSDFKEKKGGDSASF